VSLLVGSAEEYETIEFSPGQPSAAALVSSDVCHRFCSRIITGIGELETEENAAAVQLIPELEGPAVADHGDTI
jgi:hypothetical protein